MLRVKQVKKVQKVLFANNQQTANMNVTLPAGTQEGAGTYGSKTNINPVTLEGLGVTGTGNSTLFSR